MTHALNTILRTVLYVLLARFSLMFKLEGIAALWPANGLQIACLLMTPPATRFGTKGLLILFLNFYLGLSGTFTPKLSALFSLNNCFQIPLIVWLTEKLIRRFGEKRSGHGGGGGNNGGGGETTDKEAKSAPVKVDLQNVRHSMILFAAVLFGHFCASMLAGLFMPMNKQIFFLWILSESVGSILLAPCVLLMNEIPKVLRQWRALWVYGVLVAINLLYVVLRILKAGDTQLGIYLTFPWLLLMTHFFGATGAYTGCFVTGTINAFTAAYFDDTHRLYYLHGHILIHVVTCVCFVEVFRQRDEAQYNVERIVDERTAQLKETMMQLVRAEDKSVAAFESRTKLMMYICYELQDPLRQVIGLANLLNVPGRSFQKRSPNSTDNVLKTIKHASAYMSCFINDILDLKEAEIRLDDNNGGYLSVGQAAFWLQNRFPRAEVRVETDMDEEDLLISMSQEHFSKMSEGLVSHTKTFCPDHRPVIIHFSARTDDKICRFEISHRGCFFTDDDLRELVMPFSTGGRSPLDSEYAGSGLAMPIVRILVQQAGGRIHLRSVVNKCMVFITIELPLVGGSLPPGELVEVAVEGTTPSSSIGSEAASGHAHPPSSWTEESEHRLQYRDHQKEVGRIAPTRTQKASPHQSTRALAPPSTSALASSLPSSPDTRSAPILPPPTILIADDSAINRKILSRMFQLLHFQTIEACDGKDAVQKYVSASTWVPESPPSPPYSPNSSPCRCPGSESSSSNIVLVLMDINMPVMDGLEATRVLRKLGCSVPIVAVTANMVDEGRGDAEEYWAAGITEIAPKPFLRGNAEEMVRKFGLGGEGEGL
ncbi:hypothetical protein HK102_010137 [Quaeritorhiza haematococci]|nr:hypothetical protein HK102_010137 [Quaeritorhiza haematococci]